MGRDFYDAAYLMGKTKANLPYLRAKLGIESSGVLRARLLARCRELDLDALAADMRPFVIRPRDADRVLHFPELLAE